MAADILAGAPSATYAALMATFARTLTQFFALAGLATSALLSAPKQAAAWDAIGHRAITWLALDGLSTDMPAFLREPGVRHSIAWQSAEPDRWRGLNNPYIINSTYGDHFIDVEDLDAFGLTLETVSPLRYRFVRDMAVGRHEHPTGPENNHEPYNEKLDPTGQRQWAGFVPHATAEQHAKLTSMFKTYRILLKLSDENRAAQLEMAKANIMAAMGILSHYVGDTAQPLHTTKHYNGWVGENPKGYTTAKTFHAYIDGGVLALHKLDYNSLKQGYTSTITLEGKNPWGELLNHVKRSHDKMEPLYAMEKSGELQKEAGKAFITERLHDGAAMLSALYNNAWANSAPSDKDVSDFIRYDNFAINQIPEQDRVASAATLPVPTPPPASPVLPLGPVSPVAPE